MSNEPSSSESGGSNSNNFLDYESEPPSPVKYGAAMVYRMAQRCIQDDGTVVFGPEWPENAKEDMLELMEESSRLYYALLESESTGNQSGRGASGAKKKQNAPLSGAEKADLERLRFTKELADNWVLLDAPKSPSELLIFLQSDEQTTMTAEVRIEEFLRRASIGLQWASFTDWQAAMLDANFLSASTRDLVNTRGTYKRGQDLTENAVNALSILSMAENLNKFDTFKLSLVTKLFGVEAYAAWDAIDEPQRKEVRRRRYEAHVETHQGGTRKAKETFYNDIGKDMLACNRLVTIVKQIGFYTLLDPSISLAVLKTNNQSAKLAQLVSHVAVEVIHHQVTEEWLQAQDDNSIQAIAAILLENDPSLLYLFLNVIRVCNANID